MLEKPEGIPSVPGVYLFKRDETVLYVGKARSLAQRVASYFVSGGSASAKSQSLLASANALEWITTAHEADALILENELIKRYQPRFNIRLKDDKSYPFLALDLRQTFPVPFITRTTRTKGIRYFGPFGHVKSLRRTLDELLVAVPLRSCNSTKFREHQRMNRPCLLFDLKKCSGPCVGAIEQSRYDELVGTFTDFFNGKTDFLVSRLEREMDEASREERFEAAARCRDALRALAIASEEQHVVLDRSSNLDLLHVVRDTSRAVVVSIQVREGRMVGRSTTLYEIDSDTTDDDIVSLFIATTYTDSTRIPHGVVANLSDDARSVVAEVLTHRAEHSVRVVTPRGRQQRELLHAAQIDGVSVLSRDSLRRASDHNVRSKALVELGEALGLTEPPFRIECFDMSHLQGSNYVGSMVVAVDGLPEKRSYRHFNIKSVWGNDDAGAMREVIQRRLSHLAENDPAFPAPDLIIVDGGVPQLHAALEAAERCSVTDVPIVALAKREELLYTPGSPDPIRLGRGSEALYLVQRIRDEAHRFAVSFHRSKRGSAMTASVLDGVPGLGESRQRRLLEAFGSVKAIRAADREDFRRLSWLPDTVADTLYDHLHATVEEKLVKGEGIHDG